MKLKEYYTKKTKSQKLGSLLVRLFALGLTALTATVAVGACVSSNGHLVESKQNQLSLIATGIDTSVQGYLNKLSTTISMVSSDPNTVDAINALNKQKGVVVGDTTNIDDPAIKELQRQLDQIALNDDAVMHTYLGTSKDKFQKSPVENYASDYKSSQRGWYQQALAANTLVITEPYADTATGDTCITLAMPVKSNNKVIGVLGFDLDLGYIMSKSADLKLGEKGFTSLLVTAEDGTLQSIYNSNPELASFMNNKPIVDGPAGSNEISIPGLKALVDKATGEVPTDIKMLDEITINGVKYKVQAHKDEATGLTKIMCGDREEYIQSITDMISITAVILLVGGAATLYVLNRVISKIGKQISDINDTVSKIKDGDLTVQMEGEILAVQHEVGMLANNLNDTVNSLSSLMGSIVHASESLGEASKDVSTSAEETNSRIEEIATTMNEIVDGISEQAALAQESSATIAQLSNKLDELQSTSTTVTELTDEVKKENEQGIASVKDLQFYTEENNKSNEDVAATIDELSKKTASIESIVETMSAIADQTNLLALNAAIEAARAGEHGAGFSVVAGEVKKLAEQSSKYAENIRDIVNAIQQDVNSAVNVMEKSTKISEDQNKAVKTVVDAFNTISTSTESMSNSINDINNFITVLNEDKETIVTGIERIASISQRSAAASEEISASIQEQTALTQSLVSTAGSLDGLSSDLTEEVSKFDIE